MRGGRFGRYGVGRWYGRGCGAYPWPANPYPYCRNFPWLPRGWWWSGADGTAYPGWGPSGYGRPPYYRGYRSWRYPIASYQV